MTSRSDLPDLNVWLALAAADHLHHHQAIRYWETQAAEQVLFCTVTALGLVRLVQQPKLMGSAVKDSAEASALVLGFCQQPGVSLMKPIADGWELFHQMLQDSNLPARLCTDAYLAALAMANGWRLVSFDRDFERFAGLNRLMLG